ncbi:preprotein translocase subunit SecG [Mycoplasmoides gallisepticum]|uniref:Preprotein translocase subunit SecG n=3 Tax=Mycoplasmoides gallisepticum TaxID=2096 RepID=Q7NB21_MYCGA|nr:preprotein translocase subunit SecG [Mycoplasmoides gallisepticum]AAP56809.2 putative preprotein translocase subunit SecG [Mycoplasmoides gallisepticum str. R(low)]ADC30665.1 putative preprotein translocase subunit SecG [Mycoplasmoides gallisepticum str. R(high)]ADC31306.1 putative preprotein translocase subunit SecG [Mycoplasmoides gallisepticum str. F]AFP76028.1 putative preprotein translocase subunit SecG [Mycoplasmoides gallisepticum VA94_7994-1-7P]AFP76795.1 putative preprotein translo
MNPTEITFFVLAIIALIVGLGLSNSGTTGGLASLSGQDLEIFKKTKDRGIIKILQIVMFILMLLFLILGLIYHFVIK